jgi:transcriptional regulator of PTS gene
LAHEDVGLRNRQLVLNEVMRVSKISRTQIAQNLQLNIASVSRISRELIEAAILRETDDIESPERPGRKFVGLELKGDGGYIIGIGINAFRQSVTLANLNNQKIDEWIAPTPPDEDGAAFIAECAAIANAMVNRHVRDRYRFLGVGIAVAAELNHENATLVSAPAMGWRHPIKLGEIIRGVLDAPLVIDTPSSAINKAEAGFGIARECEDIMTLHCSLGFGLGVQVAGTNKNGSVQFGRTLTSVSSPLNIGIDLSAECGGIAVLVGALGNDAIQDLNDHQKSAALDDLVTKSNDGDSKVSTLFEKAAFDAANCFLLTAELLRPDMIILAGPLSYSKHFEGSFKRQLTLSMQQSPKVPKIVVSTMTPTGASRWLSLHGNVIHGNLDLTNLRADIAA